MSTKLFIISDVSSLQKNQGRFYGALGVLTPFFDKIL